VRHDRTGELVEDEPEPARHNCRRGWLPPAWNDPDERPRPCPTCKPHLARRTLRLQDVR
jgi:hypothetical protein